MGRFIDTCYRRIGKGGGRHPPAAAAIIVVINGGGGMGADIQCPPPHAPDGWPADDIATVVRFPPSPIPPATPFHPLHNHFVAVIVFVVIAVVVKQALPIVFPTSALPHPPIPSRHRPQSCLPIAALTVS
jgi:hypothetical protein